MLNILSLTLLVLVSSSFCGQECNNQTNIHQITVVPTLIGSSYSLSVSASFQRNHTVLVLNCTVTDGGTLLPGQVLVWTEGGVEELMNSSSAVELYQTSTSSLVTISNISALNYGHYTCRCHNRHSYTFNTLHKLAATGSYVQHCSSGSNETTVTAVPSTVASQPVISYHYVTAPGEAVGGINCSGGVLWRVVAGSLVATGASVTVSAPADQGKFVCLVDDQLYSIHYVSIKDYEPIQFLFPLSRDRVSLPFRVGSSTPPPLCAIYSPLALTEFRIDYKFGTITVPVSNTYTQRGPIGENMSVLEIVPNQASSVITPFQITCTVSTVWETISIAGYSVELHSSVTDLIPSVCLSASLTPRSPVTSNSTVLIKCTVTSDIDITTDDIMITLEHYTWKGLVNSTTLNRDGNNATSRHKYRHRLTEVGNNDKGTYACIADITGVSKSLNDSVYLSINDPPKPSPQLTQRLSSTQPQPSSFFLSPIPSPTTTATSTSTSTSIATTSTNSVLYSLPLMSTAQYITSDMISYMSPIPSASVDNIGSRSNTQVLPITISVLMSFMVIVVSVFLIAFIGYILWTWKKRTSTCKGLPAKDEALADQTVQNHYELHTNKNTI